MDAETKVGLIKSFAEEILTEQELRELFKTNAHPLAYDGFEPSGLAPIHFGLLRAVNLKRMLKAGVKFNLYLADYFGFINNKLGGDLEKIRNAGEYFIEVWKSVGIDTDKVKVVWAKDIMDKLDYWDKMLKVAKRTTIATALKSTTITGRKQGEANYLAQVMYPAMQVTDIFDMNIDICQLGMDQRRAHVLAREVAPAYGWKKPIAVHHHILLGLQGAPQGVTEETIVDVKMSKSNPKSAIYMHNTTKEIEEKLQSAYCPLKIVAGNPVLEFARYIIFMENNSLLVERPAKFGGDIEFGSYVELEKSFVEGKLHPVDLKKAVAVALDKMIAPSRKYFEKNKKARQLLEMMKSYQITR